MAINKKFTKNKCRRGCGEKGNLLHSWWEYKLIQSLWRAVWRFLKKLGIKKNHMMQKSHYYAYTLRKPKLKKTHVSANVQFNLVAQSCLTLCDPTDCSTPASLSITNSQSLPNSCPLSWGCHPTISSSVIPFSACP